MEVDGAAERGAYRRALQVAVAGLALVSFPLWTAPYFGEDALVVSWLRSGGLTEGLADWVRPQYGLSSVRFYRPVVSTSLALQAALSVEPLFLRLANLAVHVLGFASVLWIAARQGMDRIGLLFLAVWLCVFPGGPGNWCWIVGRVDSFSFGFGLAGAAVLLPSLGCPGILRGLAAAGLLFLALLSKESALAAGPLAAILAWTHAGRAALRAIALAAMGPVLGLLLRAHALEFSAGGYVAAASPLDNWKQIASFDAWANLGELAFGTPPGVVSFAALVIPFAGVSIAAARGCGIPGRALPVCAILTLLPLFAGVHFGGSEASHARLFPMFFALAGIAWGHLVGIVAKSVTARLAVSLAILTFPALGLVANVKAYVDAGRVIRSDAAAVASEVASRKPMQPQGSAAPILLADAPQGWPPDRPVVLLYSLGVAERFAPPIGNLSTPVWPLRPVVGRIGGDPLTFPSSEALLLRRGAPNPGIRLFDGTPVSLPNPAGRPIPEVLTGDDARAMAAGDEGPTLTIPRGPSGSHLRLVVLTPVGAAWTGELATPLSWRSLLTAPICGAPTRLYEVLGFAVDYRSWRIVFRFEWTDANGIPIARLPDVDLVLDQTFAHYVRETMADVAFGLRKG